MDQCLIIYLILHTSRKTIIILAKPLTNIILLSITSSFIVPIILQTSMPSVCVNSAFATFSNFDYCNSDKELYISYILFMQLVMMWSKFFFKSWSTNFRKKCCYLFKKLTLRLHKNFFRPDGITFADIDNSRLF